MKDQQIIIVGFMGTGKTTIARKVARKLKCRAIDLDELIARKQGQSPGEIIMHEGEQRFREIETETLREVLLAKAARIVAVGGGAWAIAENRRLIAEHKVFSVWLDAPFELCWQRIVEGEAQRPLARSRELALQLYLERRPIYELADTTVPITNSETAEEIATSLAGIIARLNNR